MTSHIGPGFTFAPNVGAAFENMDDDRAYFVLSGDLSQMGTIYTRLQEAGFPVVKSDVYPGFARDQEAKYVEALHFVFKRRIDGWWNQQHDLIKHGVCTDNEFQAALHRASASDA